MTVDIYGNLLKNNLNYWQNQISKNQDHYWTNIHHDAGNIQTAIQAAAQNPGLMEKVFETLLSLEPHIKTTGSHNDWIHVFQSLIYSKKPKGPTEKINALYLDLLYDLNYQPGSLIEDFPKPDFFKELDFICECINLYRFQDAKGLIDTLKPSLKVFERTKSSMLSVLSSICHMGINDFRMALRSIDSAAIQCTDLRNQSLQIKIRFIQAYLLFRLGYLNEAEMLLTTLSSRQTDHCFYQSIIISQIILFKKANKIPEKIIQTNVNLIKELFFTENKDHIPIQALIEILFLPLH